ncbi:hypothetical protein [Lichenifustis flavocetrariae]|uniref:PEP-CTERM sorting domain-containing protein n=1 Tax=Lichenifustis flavocetrariae TaxID=2949735 RepID=A0AA41YV81_9HYPH|nr:hypothetical protein [Lichenifustis flavocetrariae]MCW6507717.1 hypothetical protein [Lichenifustis flavocetrariae]
MVKFLSAVGATAFVVSASVLPANAFMVDGAVTPINHYFSSSYVFGDFSNAYTFTLTKKSDVNASFSGNPGALLSLSDFGIFTGPPATGYTEKTSYLTENVFGNLTAGTSSTTLDPGTYFIGVTGNSGSSTGTYDGTLSISAVPLPSTVGLFGVGVLSLGVVGALRGRSREKTSALPTI